MYLKLLTMSLSTTHLHKNPTAEFLTFSSKSKFSRDTVAQ